MASITVGKFPAIAGGFLGGVLTARWGISRALWLLGILQACSILGYWAAALPGSWHYTIYLATLIENLAGQMGSAAFMAFLMCLCDKRFGALPTTPSCPCSSASAPASAATWGGGPRPYFGYATFFFLAFLAAWPAFALLPWVLPVIRKIEGQGSGGGAREGRGQGDKGFSQEEPSPLRQTGAKMNNLPRILLTGPPQCGKTTVVQKVVACWPGQAAGFYTREVRQGGVRLGFEIVTLAGDAAASQPRGLSRPVSGGKIRGQPGEFPPGGPAGPGVIPGVDLIVVDEVGKMECLSARFVAAMESLWAAPVPLLITVAANGGGYIAALKAKPGKTLITVTPGTRERLPDRILELLKT